MQKLVTIYLDNMSYKPEGIFAGVSSQHGKVEEHLAEYLTAGWTIQSINSFGGSGDSAYARGWIAVVLENAP